MPSLQLLAGSRLNLSQHSGRPSDNLLQIGNPIAGVNGDGEKKIASNHSLQITFIFLKQIVKNKKSWSQLFVENRKIILHPLIRVPHPLISQDIKRPFHFSNSEYVVCLNMAKKALAKRLSRYSPELLNYRIKLFENNLFF